MKNQVEQEREEHGLQAARAPRGRCLRGRSARDIGFTNDVLSDEQSD